MHSAHPGLSSDYCEEDFFLPLFLDCWIFASGYCDHNFCAEDFFILFFLIVGLLHLVIEHYIVEKKIFLSLFVYSWIFLSDYCVWDNSLDDDDREDLVINIKTILILMTIMMRKNISLK